MKKLLLVLLCLSMALLPGCANIQNDSTRTTTEGTLAGAGVGAGVGALVGALVGGGRGAAIGAGIGAGVGALTGAAVGKHIADKKAEYASREDWLDACIAQARTTNENTVAYNQQLSADIAALDKESTRLAADYKRKKVSAESMVAESKAIQQRKADVDKTIAQLETEMAGQKKVVADARAGNNTREADIIENEIAKMEKQIAQMKKDSEKLASISMRISM